MDPKKAYYHSVKLCRDEKKSDISGIIEYRLEWESGLMN